MVKISSYIFFLYLMITMLMTACGPSVEEQEVAVTATQAVTTEIVDEPTVAATDTPPLTAVTSEQAEPAEATPTSAPAPKPATATPAAAAPAPSLMTMISFDGPWYVFTDGEKVWSANFDGSGVNEIYSGVNAGESFYAHLTGGTQLAFIDHGASFYEKLKIIHIGLPDVNVKTIDNLTPTDYVVPVQSGAVPEPLRAILEVENLAWSPDGYKLAYMAVSEDGSSDLFVYDTLTDERLQLTDGPSQGVRPVWSPDGRYIVHMGVGSLGTGAGWGMDGVWAAAADGSGVITLYTPDENSAEEKIIGWQSDDTFVVQRGDSVCGWRDLRAVRIGDQAVTALWYGYFDTAAVDSESGRLLVNVRESSAECNASFLSNPDFTYDQPGHFLVEPSGELNTTFSDDELQMLSNRLFGASRVSHDGQLTAWATHDGGIWIQPNDGEARQIFTEPAYGVTWSPEASQAHTLFFFASGSLYRAQAPDFEPLHLADVDAAHALDGVWVGVPVSR